ncbi:hypothetical protein BRC86_07205 [Halobacteriales archaeon QS_3_64_16]|nr:MAG: hypothetical protein BRC86_07205 [Halobacteriales archaeon QS_3_64_16]
MGSTVHDRRVKASPQGVEQGPGVEETPLQDLITTDPGGDRPTDRPSSRPAIAAVRRSIGGQCFRRTSL